MVLSRSSILVASFLLFFVVSWRVADAAYCQNVNGGCDTACPGAYSCYTNYDCGPGGVCHYYPDEYCAPGSCTCQLLVPGQWWWSCQLMCLGFCSTYMPDSDQDGLPDRFDNCPAIPNGGQRNADRDVDGDTCDCAPNDPTLHHPNEITDVRADRSESGSRFHWSATPLADRYEILGNSLGVWSPGLCLTAMDANTNDTEYVEPDIPPPSEGRWYLFRGVSNACGAAVWRFAGAEPSCP